MNANDYRENGFVDMRAYMAQFGADDEAPQQMREHTRVLELEAENVRLRETLERVNVMVQVGLGQEEITRNFAFHAGLQFGTLLKIQKVINKALGR